MQDSWIPDGKRRSEKPFPCRFVRQTLRRGIFNIPWNVKDKGLGHSNWIICRPLSHFCFQIFTPFSLSYWEANSYYPRGPILGKGQFLNSKTGWVRGFPMPVAFKLDHFQSIKPFLFWYFWYFYMFILGSHFILPQTAKNGKRVILPTPKLK